MSFLSVRPASIDLLCLPRRAVCGLMAFWLVAARSQARKARVAILSGISPDPATMRGFAPFRQTLREHGNIEGQNLELMFRWAEGRYERLPGLLQELLASQPDVLLAIGPRPAMAAKDGVPSLPVVAVHVDDPVKLGLIASIARPGANITGVSAVFSGGGVVSKRLQLLKDIVPRAKRFAILFNPDTVPRQMITAEVPEWERGLGMAIMLVAVQGPADFDPAFAAIAKEQADGLLVLADSMTWTHRARLGALCLTARLPSIWGHKDFLDAGGLVSYQGDLKAVMRRAAGMVDQILRGTKPGDIPFEQVTKLELVVNLKGARAIGVTIPNSVLVGADEVIQ